eukprot:CAMPEP_0115736880 /NCGR_PEP_ID=MMETSP0272-20121206/87495_1 /TAXON_ID=71861 /ORGANISM="Scrippsiella trochoidea, Strain CCMP3099" /LENGTH=72 /DNA_ID=CAMNT_0003181095 /DNA_START=48 /DNA_END=262 /DNA_ORIENTATION=-
MEHVGAPEAHQRWPLQGSLDKQGRPGSPTRWEASGALLVEGSTSPRRVSAKVAGPLESELRDHSEPAASRAA